MREPDLMTRKIVAAPNSVWTRVVAAQLDATQRQQTIVSQAEVVRRALDIGLTIIEKHGLDGA